MTQTAPGIMDAVVMTRGNLTVTTAPVPTPGPGEVLVKVLAAGICGSDLHCVTHGEQLLASAREAVGVDLFSMDDPVVMGHEFCGEIVQYGPQNQQTLPIGTRVACFPFLLREQVVTIGFGGPDTPGAYAEYMLLTEALLIPVPDHMPDEIVALAEPLAVALHAVNRGELGSHDVPLVIGCGPIGLAVIAILKMRGLGPIVASDFSPSRRALAKELGADIVVDPRETSPYESWHDAAAPNDPAHVGRQTLMFPEPLRPSVIFECVGVPGVIQQVLANAAACSTIVVAGLCMQPDTFTPSTAVMKEMDLKFSIAYTPDEFAQAFNHLASGELKVEPLITSRITLDDLPGAFDRLANPDHDAKIIVLPSMR
ncbi:zinc-binding dehydrogenase [Gordonia insulae]|uniref:Sorbitol dehydrogenase n=1 Tax=Gordonia insulae TaxID=2420509 RepID=A0A3G8JQ12_9ACTN|nr:zinc-binding dehydrogenase [Gordonia insulae]AZG46240.1 Sorbitol dehydrogenase [Gordonia insulae]